MTTANVTPQREALQEDGLKRTVRGPLVKVLIHRREDRGMSLEPFASRCVRVGEVHELVTTDHTDAGPGARIDRVGFLGFLEVARAGVIDRGDSVRIGGRVVGTVLGFDACHFPNHYNILIAVPEPVTGADLRLAPETEVSFVQQRRPRRATASGPALADGPAGKRTPFQVRTRMSSHSADSIDPP